MSNFTVGLLVGLFLMFLFMVMLVADTTGAIMSKGWQCSEWALVGDHPKREICITYSYTQSKDATP